MDDADLLAALGDNVIFIALSVMRVSVVFLLLPLFNKDGIPALVRNSMYLSLAVLSIFVQPITAVDQFDTATWMNLFAKEAFIGVIIGIFFGLYLWAFEAAGVVIDMQIGASFALFFDPIVGNEVTLFGSFLGRWASYVFLAAGGLMLLVGTLIESFSIWPLAQPINSFNDASVALFESEISRFMHLTVRIAGPIMVVIFLIDIAMGLVNRYAQQFNVFFLSMSIKSMAAVLLLVILLPFLIDVLHGEVKVQTAHIDDYLRRILGPD